MKSFVLAATASISAA
jgi:hypothetical protein